MRSYLALRLICCFLFSSLVSIAHAQQSTEEEAIKTVVSTLFEAMRSADSTMAVPLFHQKATLQSVGIQNGTTHLRQNPASSFVRAIGQEREEVWDEQIANLKILRDGPMAVAWMDYTFYLDDQLHHCGVNAITMIKNEIGWQIIQITDTRSSSNCPDLKAP